MKKKTPWNEEPASLICEILMLGNMFHGFSFWGDHFCSPIFQVSKLAGRISMARYPGIRYFCRKKNASTRSEVHNQNLELWSLSSLDNLFLLECNTSSAVTSEVKQQVPPPENYNDMTGWKTKPWMSRCIPCWKWSCSIVMLVVPSSCSSFWGGKQMDLHQNCLIFLSPTHKAW